MREAVMTGVETTTSSSLASLVHAAHRDIGGLFDLAGGDFAGVDDLAGVAGLDGVGRRDGRGRRWEARAADPRLTLHASDAAVAAFSAHLSVMEDVVYPAAAVVVPDGRARTAALRGTAREAAAVMRGLQQYVQGDRYHPRRGPSGLRDELAELARAHSLVEDRLLRDLEARLDAARLRRLRENVERGMRRAPTRPHPHLGHGAGRRSRLAARLAGRWDHVLDIVDARVVAGRPVPAPAPAGLWGWYLLGRPTSDEIAPGQDHPAR
ncbi:hypothetical protein CC117_09235 [Parafrankia colletiae]|uniref:Hemerythrin-like domain-containing protein n=2 Tax=Parafrankia colletiae TaxID=573497 RepID=A0A1S1RGI3_9ACTN|nr:hypothetical protein CC117_09235 [Parafrankia colletiae]